MKTKNKFMKFLNRNVKAIYIITLMSVLILSTIRAVLLKDINLFHNPFTIIGTPIAMMGIFAMAGTLSSIIGGILGVIIIYCC